jgi:hypothetical protein
MRGIEISAKHPGDTIIIDRRGTAYSAAGHEIQAGVHVLPVWLEIIKEEVSRIVSEHNLLHSNHRQKPALLGVVGELLAQGHYVASHYEVTESSPTNKKGDIKRHHMVLSFVEPTRSTGKQKSSQVKGIESDDIWPVRYFVQTPEGIEERYFPAQTLETFEV